MVSASDDLAVAFAELARSLEHHADSADTIEDIVQSAIQLIPGAEAASISAVVDGREVVSEAASSEMARLIDGVQTQAGEGPCLESIRDETTTRVPDMRTEQRWPNFARRASELGAGSMLSFHLFVVDDNLGSLNLFSSKPQAFGQESEHVGALFAAHAAVALAATRGQEQLVQALTTRDLIGQAKGILMERHKINGNVAFGLLARYSQQRNIKLRDLAEEIVSEY
ncbi:MAG: GAF and ANTAR domain-containing protein [Actinomycetes bacterium]